MAVTTGPLVNFSVFSVNFQVREDGRFLGSGEFRLTLTPSRDSPLWNHVEPARDTKEQNVEVEYLPVRTNERD